MMSSSPGGCCWVPQKSQSICTPEYPWINKKDADGVLPCGAEKEEQFLDVLQRRLVGGRLNNPGESPNIYAVFGFASQVSQTPDHKISIFHHFPHVRCSDSQGYGDMEGGWDGVERALEAWCCANDERHRECGSGWILVTQVTPFRKHLCPCVGPLE